MFIAAATATLSGYPEAIVQKVCDPLRGLPAGDEWLPSIARIRVACEREMQPVRDQERRDQVRGETLAGRTRSKPRVGSPEHLRVVEGFKGLRASLDDKPDPARPKPFSTPLSELQAKYAAAPAQVRTSEMAAYLAKIRADEEGPGDDANVSF
jgi:hypothetical protein